jgi:lipopolysaccharide transport system ATP-binding protein
MKRAIAITCQGVSKSFALVDQGNAWRLAFGRHGSVPVFHALSGVSFTVPKGEFVGILGRNGAGKSTLLRAIGGVYATDSGRITIDGALSGLYELGVTGNPQLTGRAYAQRLLTVHGFDRNARAAMVADIHDFSELGDRFEDPVGTYSAGMAARLFFATATAGHYDVYLLDEILSVGDQHFQAKCWRRLRDRISQGASGVLVTHDWSAIVKVCETAYVLERGKIAFGGAAERAARLYLYGNLTGEPRETGIARFVARPEAALVGRPGEDFGVSLTAEILQPAPVHVVSVVERLQPGFGWETSLMSRRPHWVGESPGKFEIDIEIPRLPLEPGSYQLNVHLFMPDQDERRIVLDGFSWLNGDGLTLEVEGDLSARALSLPASWSIAA